MRRLLPLASLLAALAACSQPPGPEARYRLFAEAVRAGQAGLAWSLLSSGSQQAVEARGRALAGAQAPAGTDLSGRAILLGDLALTSPKVKSVKLLRQEGDRAVVAVEDERGRRGEAALVREGGAWRVELPGS